MILLLSFLQRILYIETETNKKKRAPLVLLTLVKDGRTALHEKTWDFYKGLGIKNEATTQVGISKTKDRAVIIQLANMDGSTTLLIRAKTTPNWHPLQLAEIPDGKPGQRAIHRDLIRDLLDRTDPNELPVFDPSAPTNFPDWDTLDTVQRAVNQGEMRAAKKSGKKKPTVSSISVDRARVKDFHSDRFAF